MKLHREREKANFHNAKRKNTRQEIRSKWFVVGLALILSALIISACELTGGEAAATQTVAPTEVAAATPTAAAPTQVPRLTPTTIPEDVAEGEFCAGKDTGAKLSYREAVEIAQNSECLAEGQLKETRSCNEATGTWWFDLELDMPNCNPACVIDLNSRTAEINGRCMGVLPPPDDTVAPSDWVTYKNEKHGYSFKYPPGCFYGPMPAGCKQKPPEERAPECLCFLDGENPDQVFLQAFTGEKDTLALATFSVSHYPSPQYAPPPGTDLVEWLTEEFSGMHEEIPVEPNTEIGGIPAVRIYTPPSPMAPSGEDFYFIKDNMLFNVRMLDVDNKDNKALYDQMLSTFEINGGTPAGVQHVVAWYGYVVSTPAGSQFDDYVVVLPEGTAEVGLTGADAAIEAEVVALRDQEEPGRNAHFWGTLTCPVLDYGGCELVVSRLRPDGPGPFSEPDPVEGWEGVIYSGPPGLQVDDFFVLVGDYNVWYGIWSPDSAINNQLEGLRDTGTVIKVWGELVAGVMDGNGTQVQINRFEILEEPSGAVPPAPDWPEADDGTEVYVNEDYGYQLRVPPAATITEFGVVMLSPDEVPEGMTDEEYMAQLQEQYGDKLCVHIEYALGYMYISASPNQDGGFRFYPCGLTGLGAGETVQRTEEVTIAGQIYTAQGIEWTGNMAPCSPPRETLDCHNETMIVELEDGTRIEYGARPEPSATYEDYLIKGKEMLLRILASYDVVTDAQ